MTSQRVGLVSQIGEQERFGKTEAREKHWRERRIFVIEKKKSEFGITRRGPLNQSGDFKR